MVLETKTFSMGINSLEGKFFAESYTDAEQWGDAMNGIGNHQIIQINLPEPEGAKMMRWEKLDGIGPARYATLDQLNNVKIDFPELQKISQFEPSV